MASERLRIELEKRLRQQAVLKREINEESRRALEMAEEAERARRQADIALEESRMLQDEMMRWVARSLQDADQWRFEADRSREQAQMAQQTATNAETEARSLAVDAVKALVLAMNELQTTGTGKNISTSSSSPIGHVNLATLTTSDVLNSPLASLVNPMPTGLTLER